MTGRRTSRTRVMQGLACLGGTFKVTKEGRGVFVRVAFATRFDSWET